MYKFYKIFSNGKRKYCDTFNSTLDPNYHAYINWCRENNMSWVLINSFDNSIKFQRIMLEPEKQEITKELMICNMISEQNTISLDNAERLRKQNMFEEDQWDLVFEMVYQKKNY